MPSTPVTPTVLAAGAASVARLVVIRVANNGDDLATIRGIAATAVTTILLAVLAAGLPELARGLAILWMLAIALAFPWHLLTPGD